MNIQMSIRDIVNSGARKILIFGPECSGKTRALKEFAHIFAEEKITIVLSTRKDIYSTCFNQENMTLYYKSKTTTMVDVSDLVNGDVYLIDEICDNKEQLIEQNPDKIFVFVETIGEKNIDISLFDYVYDTAFQK